MTTKRQPTRREQTIQISPEAIDLYRAWRAESDDRSNRACDLDRELRAVLGLRSWEYPTVSNDPTDHGTEVTGSPYARFVALEKALAEADASR
jgi:hypothetical protein